MPPSSPVVDPNLIDSTNVHPSAPADHPILPSDRKRVGQAELQGHDKKRVKLQWPQKENGSAEAAFDDENSSDEEDEVACNRTRRVAEYSVHSSRNRYMQGGSARASHSLDLSTRSLLQSFVSSNKSDVFKCHSIHSRLFVNIPYACSYSNAAKRGSTPHLAVATEQGTVDIFNTSRRDDWDVDPQRVTVQPHENGIFDVKWSPSDTHIATASGDHSIRITSLESSVPSQGRTLHVLRGHEGTVKSIAWDPTHDGTVLCTGGRDGWICLWDLRVGERTESGDIAPVLSIPKAHDLGGKAKAKPARGKLVSGAPLQGITHLLYTDTHPYGVVSSCSSDGILNLWDVRLPSASKPTKGKKTAKQQHPKPLFTSADPTTYGGSRRGRGITTLALGGGPTAAVVFALGIDSRVHSYHLPSLTALSGHTLSTTNAAAANPDDPHAFSDSRMKTNSFYVRMATSPCGRWLATGGVAQGRVYLYDVSAAARADAAGRVGRGAAVELRGQTGEVGAVDWAENMLATCADDGTVRVWRPDVDVISRCRSDPEEMRWHWTWSTDA
ncbi:WD40-repeat-containing domain protein [Trametes maxima]|nr:WD40-repeat-containing domain protein [Trametes maxima]